MTCQVKTLFSWDTEFSADSAEFCPVEPFQDLLTVGTYQLAEPDHSEETNGSDLPKKRLGRLYLMQLTKAKSLVPMQQIDVPAILDLKWCCHSVQGNILLALANAASQLVVYKLDSGNGVGTQLMIWCQHEISETNTLALSLDWSTRKDCSDCPLIVVSDSKGKISLLKLDKQELKLLQRFVAHEYEAWIAGFNYWNENILYTGGDDSKLNCFDVRVDSTVPVFYSRSHNAGVTSIHASTHSEFTIASGSYDETVCLWDTRKTRSPQSSVELGGGVWRLKWEPGSRNLLLAACMHNGFHVIDTSNTNLQQVASFMGHKSLAYGADWWWNNLISTDRVVASASFYDHLLCLWEFSLN